jgi:hypothetical protein
MKLKTVFRWDRAARLLRLCRLNRTVGRVGDGKGYSSKTSLALTPRLFSFRRDFGEWILTVLGVRLHHVRSYGGIFAD